MPLDSSDRFLTAPVRAVGSFRRHLHSAICQEAARTIRTIYAQLMVDGMHGNSIRARIVSNAEIFGAHVRQVE